MWLTSWLFGPHVVQGHMGPKNNALSVLLVYVLKHIAVCVVVGFLVQWRAELGACLPGWRW